MQGLKASFRQHSPIPLDAELSCQPGELLALIGPSGSGKSTILRSIAGLYRPAEGRVSVDGEIWQDSSSGVALPTWQRRVGLVFQSYALFPHMTARNNIVAAIDRSRRDRIERAEELLTLVNLAGLGHRRPAELSGGQQQRVAVARALARDPKVLLLDEAFSAVDRRTRRALHSELKGLRRALSIPIVLVSHDIAEALTLADVLCVLEQGVTLQTGPPADVLSAPVNDRVREALDLPVMADTEPQNEKWE